MRDVIRDLLPRQRRGMHVDLRWLLRALQMGPTPAQAALGYFSLALEPALLSTEVEDNLRGVLKDSSLLEEVFPQD
ncbi:hypothetical protein M0222_01325 [Myxococcus fulvus]|nr:hypothetical protein [Myxococcus fulvus]